MSKGLADELNQGRMIEDHPYEPRNPEEPWGLCHCGAAEASHKWITKPYQVVGKFRCASCVSKDKPRCSHKAASRRKAKSEAASAAATEAASQVPKDRKTVRNNGKISSHK